jgi:hypothetical protein
MERAKSSVIQPPSATAMCDLLLAIADRLESVRNAWAGEDVDAEQAFSAALWEVAFAIREAVKSAHKLDLKTIPSGK